MTFKDYQAQAMTFDAFDGDKSVTSIAFMAKLLGLVGEAGEVAEKFKKIYRNNLGEMSDADTKEIEKELGDVLWYLAVVASYLGLSFEEVASQNLAKLTDRQARNVITSRGDNR